MANFYEKNKANLREAVLSNDNSSKIHQTFLDYVGETPKGARILDIGTGNGYVLSEIEKRYINKYDLFGVDISPDMLEKARGLIGKKANLQLADNNELPFEEAYFSTVTAKNVTNFSPDELARVLEDGGRLVFREYGLGKGLVEIAELFRDRLIRSRSPDFYVDGLKEVGFEDIQVQTFNFAKRYTLESLIPIVQMFPFIKNLSDSDLRRIEEMFSNDRKITITSDPFILTTRRRKR